jgi:phenylpropionate dioxygenase-like ring-hydroxylating dioxygenase large terminal subunit
VTTGWIPIALGKDIPEGTTRSAILDGSELVIWRGSDGIAHVWEDRCPHRGMRLSFGFVRENSLNCLYHGWQYGAASQCLRIPAHPDLTVPASIRAKAYGAAETGGMVWVDLDPASDLTPPSLPDRMQLVSLVVDATPRALGADDESQLTVLPFGTATIYLGWHIVGPNKTMLHATLEGEADLAEAIATVRNLRLRAEQEIAA